MQDFIYIANKPLGITSATLVAQYKNKFNVHKIGHMGTLDPLASGILPLGINKFTKSMPLFLNMKKTYLAVIKFGYNTTTDDSEGIPIDFSSTIPTSQDIEKVLLQFNGLINQQAPYYSALKVKGKPMYKLARDNQLIKKTRQVQIYNIKLHQYLYPYLEIEVTCGAGTYIRAIARDIGTICSSAAHLHSLFRTRYGPFFLAHLNKFIFDINFINEQ